MHVHVYVHVYVLVFGNVHVHVHANVHVNEQVCSAGPSAPVANGWVDPRVWGSSGKAPQTILKRKLLRLRSQICRGRCPSRAEAPAGPGPAARAQQ